MPPGERPYHGVSYWLDTTPRTNYPPLEADARADVAVVGAGITGVQVAYLLAKAGKSVVVLSRDRMAEATTGFTTAHLQIVIDTELKTIMDRVGFEKAKLAWDSQAEAVRLIEQIARDERIDCELERLDAILYTSHHDEHEMLLEEAELARRIGYHAEEVPADEVPYPDAKHAIRYPNQGKFHVRKYLLALAKKAEALGVKFYEGVQATDVESGKPAKVKLEGANTVTADWVVVATQIPFNTRMRLHMRLTPYNSYVVGAYVPRGTFDDVLYWDTEDPGYHYTRVERGAPGSDGRDLVILGGEDRHAGEEENSEERWRALESYLRAAAPEAELKYRWSAMWYESEDGLPYIGAIPGSGDNVLVSTGDSGTGMTNGTIAALMLAERVLGRGTPWDELYDPKRFTFETSAVKDWVGKLASDTRDLAANVFKRSEVDSLAQLGRGEGAIVRQGLKKLAVSRLDDGTLCALSATCTHAGCTVGWNAAEKAWDCPCHGSRFAPTGDVLKGPALTPLERREVEGLVEKERREAR